MYLVLLLQAALQTRPEIELLEMVWLKEWLDGLGIQALSWSLVVSAWTVGTMWSLTSHKSYQRNQRSNLTNFRMRSRISMTYSCSIKYSWVTWNMRSYFLLFCMSLGYTFLLHFKLPFVTLWPQHHTTMRFGVYIFQFLMHRHSNKFFHSARATYLALGGVEELIGTVTLCKIQVVWPTSHNNEAWHVFQPINSAELIFICLDLVSKCILSSSIIIKCIFCLFKKSETGGETKAKSQHGWCFGAFL